MISLMTLLEEIKNQPKVIFLAGPAGSGKSTIAKQLIPNSYVIINIDDTYEELLRKSGIGMSQKDFGPEDLSKAAQLMGQATKLTKEKFIELSKSLKNIVIDGTGSASNPLLKKKQELENLGYKAFMIALYVSPITSLQRNLERERNLLPSIVVRSWRDYNKNIDIYKKEFGSNFVLINNDPKEAEKHYNIEDIKKRFFDTTKGFGKEKSPEDQLKSQADKDQITKDIQNLIKVNYKFDSLDSVKQKLNNFIK